MDWSSPPLAQEAVQAGIIQEDQREALARDMSLPGFWAGIAEELKQARARMCAEN